MDEIREEHWRGVAEEGDDKKKIHDLRWELHDALPILFALQGHKLWSEPSKKYGKMAPTKLGRDDHFWGS